MKNQQKRSIDREIENLELYGYNMSCNINPNGEYTNEVIDIVVEGIIFSFKPLYESKKYYFNFSKHPLYIKYLKEKIKSKVYNFNSPEYIFDGKSITKPDNIVAFNKIANKVLAFIRTDEEAREYLACKLEEYIAKRCNFI